MRNESRPGDSPGLPVCLLVGMAGFEPTTSASRTQRSTKLSHIPTRRNDTRSRRTGQKIPVAFRGGPKEQGPIRERTGPCVNTSCSKYLVVQVLLCFANVTVGAVCLLVTLEAVGRSTLSNGDRVGVDPTQASRVLVVAGIAEHLLVAGRAHRTSHFTLSDLRPMGTGELARVRHLKLVTARAELRLRPTFAMTIGTVLRL